MVLRGVSEGEIQKKRVILQIATKQANEETLHQSSESGRMVKIFSNGHCRVQTSNENFVVEFEADLFKAGLTQKTQGSAAEISSQSSVGPIGPYQSSL